MKYAPPPNFELTRPTPTHMRTMFAALAPEAHLLVRPLDAEYVIAHQGRDMLPLLGLYQGAPAALFLWADPSWDDEGRPVSGDVTLFVSPPYRGEIGMTLAQQALAWAQHHGAQRLWTWCRSDNRPAQYVARQCGFRRCGTIPGYVEPARRTVDAICYVWEMAHG